MKIQVIFTGGTISAALSEKGISVDKNSYVHKMLINNFYNNTKRNDVEFFINQPLNILSENMTTEHLNILINEIKKIDFSKIDGVIIAHGTDTLAFTANILSVLLAGVKVPVVLVSSNYVLIDKRANGNDNFKNAVTLIENNIPGVFVVYRNGNNQHVVYLASRIRQCQVLSNKYSSVMDVDFGTVEGNNLKLSISSINPTIKQLVDKTKKDMLIYSFDNLKRCVLCIHPYTSIDYDTINLTNNIKAVVHYVYHGGTASTAIGNYNSSILTFNNRCMSMGIDLYIAPLKKKQIDNYSTNNEMTAAGIRCLYDISEENAFAKLLVGYSFEDNLKLKEIIDGNIFFEDIDVKYC